MEKLKGIFTTPPIAVADDGVAASAAVIICESSRSGLTMHYSAYPATTESFVAFQF